MNQQHRLLRFLASGLIVSIGSTLTHAAVLSSRLDKRLESTIHGVTVTDSDTAVQGATTNPLNVELTLFQGHRECPSVS